MSRVLRFKLGAEDAARFPEGDAWFTFDQDALFDRPGSELVALESAMNYTLGEMRDGLKRQSAAALRAVMWLARRDAGVVEQYDNFDPKVWRMQVEHLSAPEADVDPPADGPKEASPDS